MPIKFREVVYINYDSQMLQEKEVEFANIHESDSDDELVEYIRVCAEKLGKCPQKNEVIGHTYLKKRLGPWPRILERAGLKEKSQKRIEKEQKKGWNSSSKSVINHDSLNKLHKKAEKKLHKELKKPDRIRLEKEFAEKHFFDTDFELYEYLKDLKRIQGKKMSPINTAGYTYLIERLGPWNEIMRKINIDSAEYEDF